MTITSSFVGNLGQDWAENTLPSGAKVWKSSVAVRKSAEKTLWVQVRVFNQKQAETLIKYTKKGSRLFVSGDLDLQEFTGRDGTHKAALSLSLDRFTLCGDNAGGNNAQQQGQGGGGYGSTQPPQTGYQAQPNARQTAAPYTAASNEFEDDIPF